LYKKYSYDVSQETLEDIDKDKDGKISLQEYIGMLFDAHIGVLFKLLDASLVIPFLDQ